MACHRQNATQWARIAQNVKKPPLPVNVIVFEFFDFNVPIWVPLSPFDPKKSLYIGSFFVVYPLKGLTFQVVFLLSLVIQY